MESSTLTSCSIYANSFRNLLTGDEHVVTTNPKQWAGLLLCAARASIVRILTLPANINMERSVYVDNCHLGCGIPNPQNRPAHRQQTDASSPIKSILGLNNATIVAQPEAISQLVRWMATDSNVRNISLVLDFDLSLPRISGFGRCGSDKEPLGGGAVAGC